MVVVLVLIMMVRSNTVKPSNLAAIKVANFTCKIIFRLCFADRVQTTQFQDNVLCEL